MDHRCVAWSPPAGIEWLEDDGTDTFEVTYKLKEVDGGTRVTQTSNATLGAAKLLQPIFRAGIGADIAHQLRDLKALLESGGAAR